MKTLVNKNNTAIKIITDTLLSDSFNYITGFCSVPKSDWTLVEEEFPKIIPDEKMEQMGEEICKAVSDYINEQFRKIVEKELAERMVRRDYIEDALQQRMLDISQEPVTRMVGEQGVLEIEKVNCPFDKGNCRYCTVQFCGAREGNQIETRCPVVIVDCSPEKQPEVDLEKEIKDKYSRDTSTLKTRAQYAKVARHFYELGLKARKEKQYDN